MASWDAFWEGFVRYGLEAFGKYYSVYRAQVTEVDQKQVGLGKVSGNVDPMNQGRIEIIVPSFGSTTPLVAPAYPITPFGAKNAGMFFPPDPGDLVYVVFENGNPRIPLYLGGWWLNPRDGPVAKPSTTDLPEVFRKGTQQPTVRGIRTKSGHEILFDDTPGAGKVVIQSGSKKHQILLDDTNDKIVISKAEGGGPLISIDAGGTIRLFSESANEAYVLGTSFLQFFFNHTHPGVDNGSGTTGPPVGGGLFESQKVFGQ